ncbi:MAG: fused MFS/spermidine synthase [Gammaproteobacteria bacterium]
MESIKSLFTANLPINHKAALFILYVLFFFSGCSALIYQIIWQRMLYIVFGIDLASITIIISVFMFGLGLGGLCGGYIADKFPSRLLQTYIIIEIAIAIFGYLSPVMFETLGNILFSGNEFMTGVSSFILLAIPTLLMGATFPILVTHVNTFYQHIGRTVGSLYFSNTLGGALGAYFTGFILLYNLDTAEVIDCAAFLNLTISIVALIFFRKAKSC